VRVRLDGVWREIGAGRIRINNTWRPLTRARAYVSGAWREVAVFTPPLSVTVTPESVLGFRSGPGSVTTDSTTATPLGGLGPYSYSWARVGAGTAVATAPTSATTAFQRTLGTGDDVTETWRVTVTDGLGGTATYDVLATFNSLDPF
jgi:hypothetical protein